MSRMSVAGFSLGLFAALWAVLTMVPLPFSMPAPALPLPIGLVAVILCALGLRKRQDRTAAVLGILLGSAPWAELLFAMVRLRG